MEAEPPYALDGRPALLYLGLLWKLQGGTSAGQYNRIERTIHSASFRGWRILNARGWRKYVALQIHPAVLSSDYSFNQFRCTETHATRSPRRLRRCCRRAFGFGRLGSGGRIDPRGCIYFAGFATTANILFLPEQSWASGSHIFPPRDFVSCWRSNGIGSGRGKETLAWGSCSPTIVLTFSARTVVRNRDWKDTFALYSSAVQAVPTTPKCMSNLAGQYYRVQSSGFAAKGIRDRFASFLTPPSPGRLIRRLQFQQGNYQAPARSMEKALSLSGRDDLNYDFMVVPTRRS